MGSLENFHQAIMQRIQSGELQLGVSKMAGADPRSIAFSKFWTMFPFLAAAAYAAILWHLDYSWLWWLVTLPVAFTVGVIVRRNRGMARASRLAKADPYAFMRLWDEGALSLRISGAEYGDRRETCISPDGDYKKFMAWHFLRSNPPS